METKKVKCVDDKIKSPLTINKLYDVISESETHYFIKDDDKCIFEYNKENFEELTLNKKITKKVKCVYVGNNKNITIGKIYDVIDTHIIDPFGNFGYYIKNDIGWEKEWYYYDLFEIVEDYVSDYTTAIDPKHYQLPIEPKDFIIKNELGFCEGNVIKYICRYKQKNGIEDLKKAKQYIDFLIDEIETKSNR